MAKITFHDFGAIHKALNDLIIAEVKAALELLPEKTIKTDGPASLCRIVVSDNADYRPVDAAVTKVWLEGDGTLCLLATSEGTSGLFTEEDTDWLDISDFKYLIEQIAATVEGDSRHVLPNKTMLVCGYVPELALIHEADQLITV